MIIKALFENNDQTKAYFVQYNWFSLKWRWLQMSSIWYWIVCLNKALYPSIAEKARGVIPCP